MRGAPERAVLGLALCACSLTIGIVAWPGSGAGTPSVPHADPPGPESAIGRRTVAVPAPAVERPESRTQAPSEADLGTDESASPDVPRATVRGRVVLEDGSPASGAAVWSASARSLAGADGWFELATASAGEPCRATLPGFQPAEARPGTNGITLHLGPPALTITGRIRAEQGEEGQGWRIALLDATLVEPVALDAATHESATSGAPARVQSAVDGSFAVDGLSQRPYTLAAWRAAREQIELFAAPPAAPGEGPVEILIPTETERRTVELRCVDANGEPLASVRVGLPGSPPVAATGPDGRIAITGTLPSRLTLVLGTAGGQVMAHDVDLSADATIVLDGR